MMDTTYWRRQHDTPLFPDILWSKPETKHTAGKVTIIGGNAHAFSTPALAYSECMRAGVGVCKVVLPDAIKKTVRLMLPDAEFAPSNPSGSFSKKALAVCLDAARWSDATLIAGDLGRNSETATLLESFMTSYHGIVAVTHDAADYFKETPRMLLERPHTLIVVSLSQLQKIFIHTPLITPITFGMSLMQLVEALHILTQKFPEIIVVVSHHDTICVASSGSVTTTPHHDSVWRVKTAAGATVYWLQNTTKPFEAVTTAVLKTPEE